MLMRKFFFFFFSVVTPLGSPPPPSLLPPPRSATLLLFMNLTHALICIPFMLVREFREEEMRERVRIQCVG